MLHLATRNARVHSYVSSAYAIHKFAETPIDQLAAIAVHPTLPLLYAVRDCPLWRNLPRGLIETYAVRSTKGLLQLIAQTPMALSATGPRAIAISADGNYLLVSASSGAAWNGFPLDMEGLPAPVPVARKETGLLQSNGAVVLPAPEGIAFSPTTNVAAGIDTNRNRLSLLEPANGALAIRGSYDLTTRAGPAGAAWTPDGEHLFVAARDTFLMGYRIEMQADGNTRLQTLGTARLQTPAVALAPLTAVSGHADFGILLLRARGQESVLERVRWRGGRLIADSPVAVAGRPHAMVPQNGGVWLATRKDVRYVDVTGTRPRFGHRMAAPQGSVFAAAVQAADAAPMSSGA